MTRPGVIGVTGLPCSGKSFAAALIASGRIDGRMGELLKADDVGHGILLRPEVVPLLRGRFGAGAITPDRPEAMRRAIAARVFADADDLAWLEGLVHPLVTAELDAAVERLRGVRPVIVEAALLFAAGMEKRCDRILVIEASFETRLRRAASRGWDACELERRQERQIPLFEAAWNGPCRDRLVRVANEGGEAALCKALERAVAA